MTPQHLQTSATSIHCMGVAEDAAPFTVTLTLELPVAAQAVSPTDQPMGSVVTVELGHGTDAVAVTSQRSSKRSTLTF